MRLWAVDENRITAPESEPIAPKRGRRKKAETVVTEVKAVTEVKELRETPKTEEDEPSAEYSIEPLAPLKTAAGRIARLLCELSGDSALFVSEAGQVSERRVDTKALKEFSGVLKEMSAVMNELHATDGADRGEGVRIEFSDEALELGS